MASTADSVSAFVKKRWGRKSSRGMMLVWREAMSKYGVWSRRMRPSVEVNLRPEKRIEVVSVESVVVRSVYTEE